MFGTPSASSTPAFGTPSSAPAFGSSPSFGTPSSSPAFGAPSSAMAFGAPSSAPVFGTASSTPSFITPTSSLPFGTPPSTPAFGTPSSMPAFGAPLSAPAPSPLFPQQSQQQHFTIQPASLPFGNPQITTQMAPVAPVRLSLADRDIHAIIDAYKDEPGNPKYSFRHLLLSVTDHAARVKPFGASDISWAEAMRKLEGMDSLDRDRLWPQLVQGFKDLSDRLKLQDEVIISDAERLKMTQANVKLLQRHFQADSFQWIQRLKQKEQTLLRRLLRVMRIVEALESKGYRIPLMKGEAELSEKLAAITRQLKGPGTELSRRVHNLLSITRMRANSGDFRDSIHILGSAKLQEQSLCDLQEALQQENEAIARLGNVLKRDVRDLEIIMSEGTDMLEDGRQILKIQ
ncbi:nuclear pore complex protein NUP54-like isoform X2 [Zingiber officinale]|uniref:nuclear pore complex protein NUP54-like isoform X2 n=1 Tax=Zingiber officinale TaxID=94328 RepID=UPI001C4BEF6C|nr:nuclear pore complex protein NUP54-like isoform X2 [Zingiber officinale]